MNFDVDIAIFVVYLIINVGFGLYWGRNNKTIQEKGVTPVCVNVEGPAGIGKTSSIVQLAQELNMDIVRLNLAELEDLSDLVGFPLKEYEIVNEERININQISRYRGNYNPRLRDVFKFVDTDDIKTEGLD